jgi:hypothetical protein
MKIQEGDNVGRHNKRTLSGILCNEVRSIKSYSRKCEMKKEDSEIGESENADQNR